MSKKSFKSIPSAEKSAALSYISAPAAQPAPQTGRELENKSKRLNLLVRPSIYRQFEKVAAMSRTTPNDLINRLMLECVEREQEAIAKYNEIFGEE